MAPDSFPELALLNRDVRSWHKADVQTALMNVCFEGNNGHDADVTQFTICRGAAPVGTRFKIDAVSLPMASLAAFSFANGL